MSRSNEFCGNAKESQAYSARQIEILQIISKQIQSHERNFTFHLGSTRRSHLFADHQTFAAPTTWGDAIGLTSQQVSNILKQLEAIGAIKIIRGTGWRIVELTGHLGVTDLGVNGSSHFGVNLGVNLGVKSSENSGQEAKFAGEFGGETHSMFCFNKEKDNKLKHSGSAQNNSQLIDKRILPEETRQSAKRRRAAVSAFELRQNPAYKMLKINCLIELNNRVSELPQTIMATRPRIDLVARKVVSKWRDVCSPTSQRNRIFQDLVCNQSDVFEAIEQAVVAHGTSWFTFEWLLSFEIKNFKEDYYGPANLEKLLDGRYQTMTPYIASQRRVQKLVDGPTSYKKVTRDFFD